MAHLGSLRRSRPSADKTSTARVDIYATGCVAYWLKLTGQLVFTAESSMGLLPCIMSIPRRVSAFRSDRAADSQDTDHLVSCPVWRSESATSAVGEESCRFSLLRDDF